MSAKKRNYMAKNKKDFYSEEEIKRRVKEHNCDRTYYANKSICSKAETYSKHLCQGIWRDCNSRSIIIYNTTIPNYTWFIIKLKKES